MVNVQQWLDENYKKDEELVVEEIRFDSSKGDKDKKELAGELKIDMNDYPKLKKIKRIILSGSGGITKLTITNLGSNNEIEEIDVYGNKITQIIALEDEKSEEIDKELSKLSGLPNLRILRIQNNQLKKIDLSGNEKLAIFNCHSNPGLEIVDIADFSKLHNYNSGWKDGPSLPLVKIREKELSDIVKKLKVEDEELGDKSLDGMRNFIDKELEKLNAKVKVLEDNIKKELGDEALEEFIAQIVEPPKK